MERIAAFVIVGLTLIVLADIEQLSSIAVAFAYLILLSVLMLAGPAAFARLSALVTAPSFNSRTRSPGSSGGLI